MKKTLDFIATVIILLALSIPVFCVGFIFYDSPRPFALLGIICFVVVFVQSIQWSAKRLELVNEGEEK